MEKFLLCSYRTVTLRDVTDRTGPERHSYEHDDQATHNSKFTNHMFSAYWTLWYNCQIRK